MAGDVTAESDRDRLLVVDDDEGLRELIADFLRRYGFAVDTASGAKGVWEALARDSFQCVILDLRMPCEDGHSVLRNLQNVHRVPVVVLSRAIEAIDRADALKAGASAVIAKPCDPHELLKGVRAALPRRAAQTVTRQNKSV